ncbi:hypothetical protein [Micromonospora sp. AMSO31t]|uniref:hypothetical protein n=1 Tax=Micromonospora sp. AMSO31t TaxID=2650566 RepID=UPI00124B836F|nr:hypothetical protein [Micromonospora sp. AMSO31t]KAB1903173.1 hypothetical protein F8274_29580 [Micromonospora sp. AMSO31t]
MRGAVVLAVPAIVLSVGTPAFAGDTWVSLVNSQVAVASMQHVDDGDYFRVYDKLADGHGVRGYLYHYNSPVDKTLVATKYNGGAGTYAQFQYDVWELNTYAIQVCSVDGSNDTSPGPCSPIRNFTE